MKIIYPSDKMLEQINTQQKAVIRNQSDDIFKLENIVTTNKRTALNVLRKWMINNKT